MRSWASELRLHLNSISSKDWAAAQLCCCHLQSYSVKLGPTPTSWGSLASGECVAPWGHKRRTVGRLAMSLLGSVALGDIQSILKGPSPLPCRRGHSRDGGYYRSRELGPTAAPTLGAFHAVNPLEQDQIHLNLLLQDTCQGFWVPGCRKGRETSPEHR